MLGTILAIMASAFITGALARLAVPGPDPMPAWLTVAIGLLGSIVGGAIAAVLSHRDPYAVSVGSFVAAVLLVIGYRTFVQKRPIVGRDALRFPKRGVGVPQYRDRLRRAGIDPDRLPFEPGHEETPPAEEKASTAEAPPVEPPAPPVVEELLTPEQRTEALRRLAAQLEAGEIGEDEYRDRRRRIVYGDAG